MGQDDREKRSGTAPAADQTSVPFSDQFQRALALHQKGDVAGAAALYQHILLDAPLHADSLHLLGVARHQLGDATSAVAYILRAIARDPTQAFFHTNLGNALKDLGQIDRALAAYQQAIRLNPTYADAWYNLGIAQAAAGLREQAVTSYDAAVRLNPRNAFAFNNRGNLQKDLGLLEQAVASYDAALDLNPGYADALINRGIALQDLGMTVEALASFIQARKIKPDNPDTHNHIALALQKLGRTDEALTAFAEAIRLKPNHSHAFYNRGNLYKAMKRLDAALSDYDTALRLNPDYAFLPGVAAHVTCAMGRWGDLDERVAGIVRGVNAGRATTLPFALLALVDDPNLHRRAAEIWVRDKLPPTGRLGPFARKDQGGPIHIAYLSGDFQYHATTHLMAELFELHDRSTFTLTALSFGPRVDDTMRRRVSAAFDHFEEVNDLSDIDVARLCRKLGVDIAVDLKGYTADMRAGILAEGCAPVQMNWLGYPGTMGASFIHYIIADHTLIGANDLRHYAEKVIWLPDTYQCNDGKRPLAQDLFTRTDCGLPEDGFVYCCFNNNYKILPATFDVWMRVLARVPNSVLWLLEDNPNVAANLKAEAVKRGIAAQRLVFAKRMSVVEHMARHKLADLFLDSRPYNAHTTTSDALWAGVPVLTCPGRSFPARVAASLLHAVGLPELIVPCERAYEEEAVALAQDSVRLSSLRTRLETSRSTAPLFDCARFARHLEHAYKEAMRRHWQGEAPDHIDIAAL